MQEVNRPTHFYNFMLLIFSFISKFAHRSIMPASLNAEKNKTSKQTGCCCSIKCIFLLRFCFLIYFIPLLSLQIASLGPNSCRHNIAVPPSAKNCIQLAACASNELLPMNPELPADLFTSCLTTPIKIALRW